MRVTDGAQQERRIFLIPRKLADEKARRDKPTSKTAKERYWRIDEVAKIFADFEGMKVFLPPCAATNLKVGKRRRVGIHGAELLFS
jgi:hypothetical protein